jgi:polysaccharide export outer membrane protein
MKDTFIAASLLVAVFASSTLAGQQGTTQPATAARAADKASGSISPSPSRSEAADPNEYRLAAGDKLRIEVYKDQQLSQSVQVRPDGKITLPLIGDVDAAGHTPIAVRDTIATALKEYVTNPTVTVIVVEAAATMAYVMGEVSHPGSVMLQGGPVTVLQALALAGGLKDFADTKNIRILRRASNGVQTIPFNYKEAIRGGAPAYLQPGDTVVVPD